MSYNQSQSLQGRQSTGSCNAPGFEAYMFGSSPGVGSSASTSGVGAQYRGRRESVRDCMQWSEAAQFTGNAGQLSGEGYSNGFGMSPNQMTMYTQSTPQGNQSYSQPRAFVSAAGQGQGEGEGPRVSIPCQIAPLGTNPASLLKPMEPVTLRVTAPNNFGTNPNGNREPITFTINPEEIYSRIGMQHQ